MKKNKTVAFMLAASLMVGGTFLGTKAWFTDNDTVSNDLILTMGTLDVIAQVNGDSTEDDSNWKIVNAHTEINDENNVDKKDGDLGNNFKNVSPRDSFEKTITVKNVGTLDQQITMSDLDLVEGKVLPNGVTVELKVADKTATGEYRDFANNDKSYKLAANTSKEFKVVVTFDGEGTGGEYSETQGQFDGKEENIGQTLNIASKQSFNFSEYFKTITIEADQVNKLVDTPEIKPQ